MDGFGEGGGARKVNIKWNRRLTSESCVQSVPLGSLCVLSFLFRVRNTEAFKGVSS